MFRKKQSPQDDDYTNDIDSIFGDAPKNPLNSHIKGDSPDARVNINEEISEEIEGVSEEIEVSDDESSKQPKKKPKKKAKPSFFRVFIDLPTITKLLIIVGILLGGGMVAYKPFVNGVLAPYLLERAKDKAFSLNGDDFSDNENRVQATFEENPVLVRRELFNYDDVELLPNFTPTVATFNKDNVVGGIYIPSVNVRLPIMYGTTNENLLTSATTMKPEQKMGKGNYALAGHNSRNPDILFAPLKRSQIGEAIYLTNKKRVYKYIITYKEVVEPTRVEVIEDTDDRLVTLVSCYAWDGSNRLIIQGELTSVGNYDEVGGTIREAFNDL